MRVAQRLVAHSLVTLLVFIATAAALRAWTSWRALALTLVITVAAAALAAPLLVGGFTRALRELNQVTRMLAEGNLSFRPSLNMPGEVGDLANGVHRLAEQLGSRIDALQAEDALLGALIDSLNEGVIAVNSRQEVVRINAAGRQLLRLRDVTVPFPADRLPRDRPLHQAIHGALRGHTTEPIETTIGDHRVSLTARPLVGGGAVLALFDLTQIRRLEQVRRDFVANVSHELRTPLTVVGGFAETLLDDELPGDRRKHFAEMIRGQTLRMQRIVDDLLDLSRIESGGWVPSPVKIDAAGLATDALTPVQPAAKKKGLELHLDIDWAASFLEADRTAVRQVLSNLLENAVRHTAAGSVTIFTEPDAGGVWLGVRDTGPGIAAEHLPRIFERFYRVDTGRARESGGTGLGLAIVKHLVEAHGGRVRAESEVGRGTTIAAFFPRPAITQLTLDVVE